VAPVCDRQSCGSRFNQSAGLTAGTRKYPGRRFEPRGCRSGSGRHLGLQPQRLSVYRFILARSVSPRTGAPVVRRHHHRVWTEKQKKLVRWHAGYTAGVGRRPGLDFCLNPRRVLSRVQDPGWTAIFGDGTCFIQARIAARIWTKFGGDDVKGFRSGGPGRAAQLCRNGQAIPRGCVH
jgi:hypothetical protein